MKRIRVKVTPWAKKKSIKIETDLLTGEDVYLVKLHAKPINGEANKALIKDLATYFDVRPSLVSIVKWWKSQYKRVEIGGK